MYSWIKLSAVVTHVIDGRSGLETARLRYKSHGQVKHLRTRLETFFSHWQITEDWRGFTECRLATAQLD